MKSFVALVAALGLAGCSEKTHPAASNGEFDTGPVAVRDSSTEDTATATDTARIDSSTTAGDSVATTDTDVAIDTSVPDTSGPAICPKGYAVATGVPVSYAKSSNDLLAAITWDELTMAWTTTVSGKTTVYYADRDTRDAAFGTPRTLPDTLGPFSDDKVAIAADGRTLLFTSFDHRAIKQITRASRGAAFDEASVATAPFKRLMSSGEGGTPKEVADLVLSMDGNTLFYTDLVRAVGSTLRMTRKLGTGEWDDPIVIESKRLEKDVDKRRRPSGLSADGRTLFLYDEADEAPFVAFRAAGSATFTEFYPLSPNGKRPMPSASCTTTYLSAIVTDEDARTSATTIVRSP